MSASVGQIDPDAILESIVELRFDAPELPEVTLGRILTTPVLEALNAVRLPESDIPMSAREADHNLMYQSVFQVEADSVLVRVAYGSVSIHSTAPYPGWGKFSQNAISLLSDIWHHAGKPELKRCSLRYINALTSEDHLVSSVEDMNLEVNIGKKKLVDLAVNFVSEDDESSEAFVRVASAKHVRGDLPEDTTFVVDIDVRTIGSISNWSIPDISRWLDTARDMKNEQFFSLLPDRVVSQLSAGE